MRRVWYLIEGVNWSGLLFPTRSEHSLVTARLVTRFAWIRHRHLIGKGNQNSSCFMLAHKMVVFVWAVCGSKFGNFECTVSHRK